MAIAFIVNCSIHKKPFHVSENSPQDKNIPLFSIFKANLRSTLPQVSLQFDVAKTMKNSVAKLVDVFVDSFFEFIDKPLLPSKSNFAPVEELGEAIVVSSIQGQIPKDFPEGVYIRNGGPGNWEALWKDQARDMYLRELYKAYASLKEVSKALALFNFHGGAGVQVMHLARMIDGKIEALNSAHKELEFLRSQNASLTQRASQTAPMEELVVIVELGHAKRLKQLGGNLSFRPQLRQLYPNFVIPDQIHFLEG
ncbi:unnamed protein product [Vicia faba]|uniref:Uncharacterized protein n=1 Tax=Vicia faba TaxID=3906 RepID=A0AAV0ZQ91_VICFA|nr:unnamed protein product [Vicia faba]